MRARLLMFLCATVVVGCQEKKVDAPDPASNPAPAVSPAPAVVATPAIAGMIRGKPFTPDQIEFESRRLAFLKVSEMGLVGITFELPKINDKTYEGKEWTFAGNNRADPLIDLRSADEQGVNTSDMIWGTDYTMTLKVLKQTAKSMEGTIDLKMKNVAETYLKGKFTAIVKKSASDPPDASEAPYVHGKIEFVGDWKDENVLIGFVGTGDDGRPRHNAIRLSVSPGLKHGAISETFTPQITGLMSDGTAMLAFHHTKLTPGDYVIYAKCNDVPIGWKKVTVKADDQQTVDFTLDPSKMGDLTVTLPDAEVNAKSNRRILLIPDGLMLPAEMQSDAHFSAGELSSGEKTLKVKRVPAGKYTVKLGKNIGSVEVVAGKETAVTLK